MPAAEADFNHRYIVGYIFLLIELVFLGHCTLTLILLSSKKPIKKILFSGWKVNQSQLGNLAPAVCKVQGGGDRTAAAASTRLVEMVLNPIGTGSPE
jgi:hypothetical protein